MWFRNFDASARGARGSIGMLSALAMLMLTTALPPPAWAQQRAVDSAGAEVGPSPVLAIVEPSPGGTVLQRFPVTLLRYHTRDAADPIDERSLVVLVDDEDRSGLFRAGASQALGLLAAPPDEPASGLAVGRHEVVARVCTVGGACAEARAEVNTVAEEPHGGDRKCSLLELLVSLARKIFNP